MTAGPAEYTAFMLVRSRTGSGSPTSRATTRARVFARSSRAGSSTATGVSTSARSPGRSILPRLDDTFDESAVETAFGIELVEESTDDDAVGGWNEWIGRSGVVVHDPDTHLDQNPTGPRCRES